MSFEKNKSTFAWAAPRNKRRGASVRKKINFSELVAKFFGHLRFWSSIVTICFLMMLPYIGYRYIVEQNPFPIKRIHFEGKFMYLNTNDLQSLSAVAFGENFLTFDLDLLQKKLQEEPWFESLSLERQWPDTIQVHFKEKKPKARWGLEELVTEDGHRFKPRRLPEQKMVFLMGPDGQEKEVIQFYTKIQAQLKAINLEVSTVQMDRRHAWTITLDNKLQILLGTSNLDQRLDNFIEYYPRKIAHQVQYIKSVDLRYNNGFAIKWKQVLPESHIDSVVLR